MVVPAYEVLLPVSCTKGSYVTVLAFSFERCTSKVQFRV
jgi:hypothetical protein